MKKVNFDSLKSLEAPKSWIENAINIPQTKKAPPVFFFKYSRAVAFAATFVLVCAISITLFLHQNNDILKIEPTYSSTQEALNSTQATQESDVENTEQEKAKTATDSKQDSKPDSNNQQNLNGGAPLEDETLPSTNKPETDKPVTPTDGGTPEPTLPSNNNTDNTSSPQPPATEPTNPLQPTQTPNNPAPGSPQEPTEETIGKPDIAAIAHYQSVHDYCEIIGYIETKHLTGSGNVYCQLSKRGLSEPWLGSSDYCGADHLCTIWMVKDGYTYFAYDIPQSYEIEHGAQYLFIIYNESGQILDTRLKYL
ncbi:MAG: hypothetical protein IJD68_00675 [Ruminococcus sp.]|nr:hypothetical protein [Ruminococcus sp.]